LEKNDIEIKQLFGEIENMARKLGLHIKQGKTKYVIVEWKNSSKQPITGQLTIKKTVHLKELKILNNGHQTDLQERIKNANKTYFILQKFFRYEYISKQLKLRLKNTIIDITLTYALETWILTKRDRKQINIFERKVYRRILGPV